MKICNKNPVAINKYLEDLIIVLDEEDIKVLPNWRVKCIDLLDYRIKDVLREYHTKRFSYDGNEI